MPQEAADFIVDKMPIPETPLLAVGYWIARPLWGKGYAGEMLQTMRPLCAKLFHRTMLGAMVYDGNVASLRALARANFTNIGLLESQTGKKAGAKAHVLVWRSPI
jgi:RimJ/RimL family protein N-acetyltransferase